jgi:hypothetical protein
MRATNSDADFIGCGRDAVLEVEDSLALNIALQGGGLVCLVVLDGPTCARVEASWLRRSLSSICCWRALQRA